MTLSPYQENLLALGPFGVRFDDVQTLCSYHFFYRFSESTVRVFRARFPEQPVKIGEYIYLIETSAAGPRISDGRIARLIQVSIVNPQDSQIVETGTAAVKRVWKGIIKQGIDIERAVIEGGQI
jgi:hypothetical protein